MSDAYLDGLLAAARGLSAGAATSKALTSSSTLPIGLQDGPLDPALVRAKQPIGALPSPRALPHDPHLTPLTPPGAPGYTALQQAADRLAQATAIIPRYPAARQEREILCEAAATLIAVADQEFRQGHKAAAEANVRVAEQVLEVALTVGLAVLLPEAGIALSILALARGKSALTNEPLTPLSKALEVVNILSLGSLASLSKAGALLRPLVGRGGRVGKRAQGALQTLDAADRAAAGSHAGSAAVLGSRADAALIKQVERLQLIAPKGVWKAHRFGPNWPHTTVPRGFHLDVGGHTYRVHPNATKHMSRYLADYRHAGHQHFPLSPFARAVEQASESGLQMGKNRLTVAQWELGIDLVRTERVVYHAVYHP